MKMTVIGSGYVGTVTGTCMAELGHDVTCADIQKSRMETLSQGIVPFYEAGLESLIRTNMAVFALLQIFVLA
jgi:UDPglucose 6-dehydrogenase